jgi:hypothetical protein
MTVVRGFESIFVVELYIRGRMRDILETIVVGGNEVSQDRNQWFVMSMVVKLGDSSR